MKPSTLPHIEPLHPTRARQPFHRDGWVYERNKDGSRITSVASTARRRV